MTVIDARGASEVRSSALGQAARDSGVLWLGLFALGIGFGVVVTGNGLPWWLAPVISAVMFAGSVEFILVGMLAAAVPIAAIAMTTFLVNSRHLFYGLSFPLHRVNGRIGKAYSIFALTDEAYVIMTRPGAAAMNSAKMLWTQGGLHLSWVSGALVGGLVGETVFAGVEGLDFVLTALFVVLTMDAFRAQHDVMTIGLAAGAAVVAAVLVPGSMMLVAMSVFTVALVVRHLTGRRTDA